ncbi:MAG TPA: fumarylacetoacetate hydrolase family protein [Stellaceae bacterium]|nr:fumarylacetoacetate hydrolase family protein [Stellaceae bacterium]
MRWVRFEKAGRAVYGIVEGEAVVEVAGDPFAGYERTATRHPLSSVKLLVPVEPRTFYAAGLNYAEHVTEAARRLGREPELPPEADIGYRANNALIAHGEAIVIPKDASDLVQYEAELVAVIGKQAKYLSERDALSCVLGWTIGNDMSERTWQRQDRTLWRAKNTDTFKPMGPWIETDFDLDAAETIVRVNGEETNRFRTNHMIHGVAKFLARMSQYLTLYPGDVVWMGTDGWPKNLKHGDTVEIEITGIGTLRNPVVREGQ